eukprot:TRINITY_DN4183_c0_g1_i1.p1 TRINITY_DN4183_c0_g1~~TRINITY_DN4183_c0_g1_i1.p1  ORF type:complete len:146 (+),score=21.43 TRINITY_DN4183_c0_g1_i1:66-440(+)
MRSFSIFLFVCFLSCACFVQCEHIQQASSSEAWSCDTKIAWHMPAYWYAGNLRVDNMRPVNCSTLETRSDMYMCAPIKPWIECNSTTTCPKGSLCAGMMVPPLCVTCEDKSSHSFFEYANITVS